MFLFKQKLKVMSACVALVFWAEPVLAVIPTVIPYPATMWALNWEKIKDGSVTSGYYMFDSEAEALSTLSSFDQAKAGPGKPCTLRPGEVFSLDLKEVVKSLAFLPYGGGLYDISMYHRYNMTCIQKSPGGSVSYFKGEIDGSSAFISCGGHRVIPTGTAATGFTSNGTTHDVAECEAKVNSLDGEPDDPNQEPALPNPEPGIPDGDDWHWGQDDWNWAQNDGPSACEDDSVSVGDPIHLPSGKVYEFETDYKNRHLALSRAYTAMHMEQLRADGNTESLWNMGVRSRLGYQRKLEPVSAGSSNYKATTVQGVSLVSASGKITSWFLNGNNEWVTRLPKQTQKLALVYAPDGLTITKASVTYPNHQVDVFDGYGRLIQTVYPDGDVVRMTYQASSAYDTRLATVTDSFGHALVYEYDPVLTKRLISVTVPGNRIFRYGYDAAGRLNQVTYPDNTRRQFAYEDTRYPWALTSVFDENGQRYAYWQYDSLGRAIVSTHTPETLNSTDFSKPNGVDWLHVLYDKTSSGVTVQASLVDSLLVSTGTALTVTFTDVPGGSKPLLRSHPTAAGTCPSGQASYTYDTNGNLLSSRSFDFITTSYEYDPSTFLLKSRTEAKGTALERTTLFTWYADPNSPNTLRLPKSIVEPGRTTEFQYDAQGHLSLETVTDTMDLAQKLPASYNFPRVKVRETSYDYVYFAGTNQVQKLTVHGPRTDVNDDTVYEYNAQGQLMSIKNALGFVTLFSDFNEDGLARKITAPNGVVTTLTYTWWGRIKTRTVQAAGMPALTTAYEYWPTRQLKSVKLPNGNTLAYTYDAAHRLTDIADQLGNKKHITYDRASHITDISVNDNSGALAQALAEANFSEPSALATKKAGR